MHLIGRFTTSTSHARFESAGYKLRTDRWAYTAWMSFDWGVGSDPKGEASVPVFSDISALELYDHDVRPIGCGSDLVVAGNTGCFLRLTESVV